MKIGVMQPYFFPYMGYFQLIHAVDTYVNLDHVSFMKRSYMTRNTLKDGISMNVNVKNGSQNKKCTEVDVLFDKKYLDKFHKRLEMMYSRSPYYQTVMDEVVMSTFEERQVSISQFNLRGIKAVCEYLGFGHR